MSAALTPGDWEVCCDSYGRVQHSKKACVSSFPGLVKVAAQIPNWADAHVLAAGKEMLAALTALNHVAAPGYCVCPLNNGTAPHEEHATACQAARYAVAKASNRTWATGGLLPDAFTRQNEATGESTDA